MSILTRIKNATNSSLKTVYPKNGLLKDFLGLPENVLGNKTGWKKLLIPFFVLANVISFPFNFILSIIKIVTEFLPLTIYHLLTAHALSLLLFSKDQRDKHPFRTAFAHVLFFLSHFIYSAYLMMRCIFSPMTSVKFAWEYGYSFNKGKIIAFGLGLFFAACSIGMTISLYAIFMPFAIMTLSKLLSLSIPPIFTTVGKITLTIMNAVLHSLISVSASAELVGLSTVIGLVLTVPLTLIDTFIIEPVKAWWNVSPVIPSNKVQSMPGPAKTFYSKLLSQLGYESEQARPRMRIEDDTFSRLDSSEEDEFSEDLFVALPEEESDLEDLPTLPVATHR
jgi:hypothetical protein